MTRSYHLLSSPKGPRGIPDEVGPAAPLLRNPSPMNRNKNRRVYPVRHAGDWISLAAAPTFAVMALLTSMLGGEAPKMLCSAAHASPLSGMIPMYLLMSVFHSAPWLNLMSRRKSSARGSSHMGCTAGADEVAMAEIDRSTPIVNSLFSYRD